MLTGTFALMVAFGEVGIRIVATATNRVRGATYDPALGWRLVPGIIKKDRQWCDEIPAETNSFGWRDEERPLGRSKGIKRIVALGDSFTFGYGVDYGNRFSEVLEENVAQLDVVNMGVFAYSTDQEVRVYELYASQFEPDIVLLNVYLGNDLDDLRLKWCMSFPKPYFVPEASDEGELRLVDPERSAALFLRTHSYLGELLIRAIERGKLYSEVAPELANVDMRPLFYALVDRLAKDVASENRKLLIVLIHPREASTEERRRNEEVARELGAGPYAVLDLYLPFVEKPGRERSLYLPDGHWSPAGHRLAAEKIQADLIRRKWIEPERSR